MEIRLGLRSSDTVLLGAMLWRPRSAIRSGPLLAAHGELPREAKVTGAAEEHPLGQPSDAANRHGKLDRDLCAGGGVGQRVGAAAADGYVVHVDRGGIAGNAEGGHVVRGGRANVLGAF